MCIRDSPCPVPYPKPAADSPYPIGTYLTRLRLGPSSSVAELVGRRRREWGVMVVHDGQVAVEVRHGKAVDHRERHPGRAREPGRGLPGPHLSQRLLADGAGARACRAVLAAPRIHDPLSRGGGEDGTGFRDAVKTFAEVNHIPVVRFGKKDRKLSVMQPHLDRQAATGRAGVAAIGVAQEFQRVFTAATGAVRAEGGAPHFSWGK